MMKTAYTVREVLHELGICRSTLYKEIGAGRLRARKIGSKTVFLAEDVQSYVERLPHFRSRHGGGSAA